jgi:hypothetical protein
MEDFFGKYRGKTSGRKATEDLLLRQNQLARSVFAGGEGDGGRFSLGEGFGAGYEHDSSDNDHGGNYLNRFKRLIGEDAPKKDCHHRVDVGIGGNDGCRSIPQQPGVGYETNP